MDLCGCGWMLCHSITAIWRYLCLSFHYLLHLILFNERFQVSTLNVYPASLLSFSFFFSSSPSPPSLLSLSFSLVTRIPLHLLLLLLHRFERSGTNYSSEIFNVSSIFTMSSLLLFLILIYKLEKFTRSLSRVIGNLF